MTFAEAVKTLKYFEAETDKSGQAAHRAQALKALKESIAHWRRLATGKLDYGEKPDGEQCSLCLVFAHANHGDCTGCPIMEKTGLDSCRHTPYEKASTAFFDHGGDSPQFRAAAKKELAFLKSLLPKKGKQ